MTTNQMKASPMTTTKPTVVLVGYGMVGHRFLEALADTGAADRFRVVVLAEEPRPAYDRVALTSYFSGRTPEDLLLGEPGFLDAHGFELHLNSPVTEVDRAGRTVTTAAGHTVAYDTLVLATGSYPFVPPVQGKDADGCFVYRTIEDLHAIEAYAADRKVGAVVGGGLLGLEAAGALKGLGLETHVVEFAPRLMPVQVDEGGGEALRRTIEEMGVTVHTGVGTNAIVVTEGAASGMTFTNGEQIDTDLVVFSAGVRPRDQLARDCGLTVGERGGIAVDALCRTSDEAVYAIGECALAVDGRVYGLVAPGYEMATTVAHQLAGQAAKEFTGADLSTKLKLLGVDVASFGDAFGTTPGALDVVYSDSRSGIYKKLVVTAEGALLGGILVGDAEAYSSLRPLTGTGTPLPVPAESLVLPAGLGAPVSLGSSALPDDAVVCNCHNVTKGAVRAAVTDHQCGTVPEVKKCTKAGTGCGSCLKLLSTIVTDELEASGVEVDKGLCPCFAHTRAELYEIVRVKRIATHRQLLAEHGRLAGEGCEVCKPTVGSIIASLAPELAASGHILDGEQAALQDTNDHFLANLQRNGSYSVVPRIPGGEITPEKLIVIGEVARDFGLYTKITGGQRIDLFGAAVDQLPLIWARLVAAGFESGHAYGKSLRTVKSCVGSTWCRYGVQDSVAMAIHLELRYRGLRSPHKLKSAVSGCARECAEARGKDFGVIATSNGWNLYVGGNGGATPRHADLLAQDLTDEELIRLIDRFLMFYIRTADRLERTSAWLERIDGGLEHVRQVVVEDSLGLAADLEALMANHVTDYQDEWAATLADQDRLQRFVSFVNAPGVPDPSIRFTPERDQVKPDLGVLATAEDLLATLSADLLEIR
ncbi:nitrite reductase (NADH) large subunit [Kitasatospora gansuensis]|uniref:assimilatory sulfite reductase (ferredoxin) n=1 Tax=Kitasatospora gansuensis TaxID=258050 RepID=A0A7W7WJX7_9ACTN|nr:nitrite reductase large subunit NirB [Kitasatospora gansuensis]MBB4949425.1 nitrite reductase (NADH) large subunit [Kitasatospora gansuensis]